MRRSVRVCPSPPQRRFTVSYGPGQCTTSRAQSTSNGFAAFVSGVGLTVWFCVVSTESFADLAVAVLYLFWLLPLTVVALIGSFLPARAGSRWSERRRPTGLTPGDTTELSRDPTLGAG